MISTKTATNYTIAVCTVLLTLLLCCSLTTAVNVGSGVVFNFTNTSITTGAPHSWTSVSVQSDHLEMGSDKFGVDPTNQTTIWNWVWGDEVTYNTSCAGGNVWFNLTHTTWGDNTVEVYVNNTLEHTTTASDGVVNYNYSGGWSEKYFRFVQSGVQETADTLRGIMDSNTADAFSLAGILPLIILVVAILGMLIAILSGHGLSIESIVATISMIVLLVILYVGLSIINSIPS